jgi:tRNA (cytidine/uridine-2'-O-)-methyltransferase
MENNSLFKIVLFAPEIPGNTGSIGRTCVALNLELILIKPLAFDIDEKAVRRAGLDYWKHIKLKVYESWDDFLEIEQPEISKLYFYSKNSKKIHYSGKYTEDCYLVFGPETKGLPMKLFADYGERFYALPIFSEHVRSLNLASAATAVSFEVVRQLKFLLP